MSSKNMIETPISNKKTNKKTYRRRGGREGGGNEVRDGATLPEAGRGRRRRSRWLAGKLLTGMKKMENKGGVVDM